MKDEKRKKKSKVKEKKTPTSFLKQCKNVSHTLLVSEAFLREPVISNIERLSFFERQYCNF